MTSQHASAIFTQVKLVLFGASQLHVLLQKQFADVLEKSLRHD